MLGIWGDSLMLGLGVGLFLLLTVGLWYTLGVRMWRKFIDQYKQANDTLARDDRYESPEEKFSRRQR